MRSLALSAAVLLAIAAGATVLSHVNDSGFWLVSKYLGLSEKETLQTWTVTRTPRKPYRWTWTSLHVLPMSRTSWTRVMVHRRSSILGRTSYSWVQ